MNWQHLQAFVWLRWRLLWNQWRRAGAINVVLMAILITGALVTVIPLSIACFVLGLYAIPRAAPAHLLYAWDGLVVAFLFFWVVGLVTELQRTEPLSLAKFMHLPVSANGAFLINYVSSLFRLSLIVFGPLMLAFALALVVTKGILLLPVVPAFAAFLMMVTALTYQLQGWLAALDEQPPAPPDGGRGHHRDLRAHRSTAKPAQLLRAVGTTTAQTRPRLCWNSSRSSIATLNRRPSMPLSSRVDNRRPWTDTDSRGSWPTASSPNSRSERPVL